MKLKTDSNALLTAAAFGTATFMVCMLNQGREETAIDAHSSETVIDRVQRSAGLDEDESQHQYGECSEFRLDGEDCNEDNEETDDVSMFANEEGPGDGRKRGKKLFTIRTWETDKNKFNNLLVGLEKKQKATLARKSPKNYPVDFSNSWEPPIIRSGSPWFDGDFEDYNDMCGSNGNIDMDSNNFLRSFNIYYPQEMIYDSSVDQMDLWNAYLDFNTRLSYNIASSTNAKSAIVIQGYRGSVMQRPYKFLAKDAKSKSQRQWESHISKSYGILEDQGFMVPSRRGKKGTMIISQPKFKSFNDYWTNRHKSAKIQDMTSSEETCITVLIMHQAFFDAATIDNWSLGGTGKQQQQANENYNQCVIIPVFVTPQSAGYEDWMRSTARALVPSTMQYAQLHEDKKMYHVVTPQEFIDQAENIADNISQWSCTWNNRAQCYHTADPESFQPEEIERALTTEATTTESGTTTTAWETTGGTTTSPYVETTVSSFDTTEPEATTAPTLLNYCCFGKLDSVYGNVETCPSEVPVEE